MWFEGNKSEFQKFQDKNEVLGYNETTEDFTRISIQTNRLMKRLQVSDQRFLIFFSIPTPASEPEPKQRIGEANIA